MVKWAVIILIVIIDLLIVWILNLSRHLIDDSIAWYILFQIVYVMMLVLAVIAALLLAEMIAKKISGK